MNYLVTGTAGFIGHFVAQTLAKQGANVTGVDSINDYYDQQLKLNRLADSGFLLPLETKTGESFSSEKWPNYRFRRLNLVDKEELNRLFIDERFDVVIHLAAQPGVRYSLENPDAYIQSNICGFMNILENCRHYQVKHLVYASSSSVYGQNASIPFKESDPVDHPISLYAATKRSNELIAHSYSHLFQLPTTGLRFFTVYGPWGRPDMSPMLFAKAILAGDPIKVFNSGDMLRDFTFIGDIVEGVLRSVNHPPKPNKHTDSPHTSTAPFRIFNIGNAKPIALQEFIASLELGLNTKAKRVNFPMQPGDVKRTWADSSLLQSITGYRPSTNLQDGVNLFCRWYLDYYNSQSLNTPLES